MLGVDNKTIKIHQHRHIKNSLSKKQWKHPAERISNCLKRRHTNSPHSPFFCLGDPSLHSSSALSLLTHLSNQPNSRLHQISQSTVDLHLRRLPHFSPNHETALAFADNCEKLTEMIKERPHAFLSVTFLTKKGYTLYSFI